MSKHRAVDAAIEAMIAAALPGAKVRLMSPDEAKPETVGPLGDVIVRHGDAGNADIDLSPPAYNFERTTPIELAAADEARTGIMLAAIAGAIEADRTLGGLCHWLDAEPPVDGESEQRGVRAIAWTDFAVLASYTTSSPLG